MIQVQRFNKALKSAVIIGDLVILDVLFVLQYILKFPTPSYQLFE